MSKDPTINIAELEKLARAATAGEWKSGEVEPNRVFCRQGFVVATACSTPGQSDRSLRERAIDQAAFIASANPQTILTLIAALREAKGALEKIETNPHWPEIIKPCATKTLRSMAEKVEGL